LKTQRRHRSAEEKIKLLRRHLIEKVPVSKICEEAELAPSMYHRWQEQLFVNGALALEGKQGKRTGEQKKDQQRIEKLENKIRQKDEVLAELMAEHVALKKELGEL
jgi:transposase-like protein